MTAAEEQALEIVHYLDDLRSSGQTNMFGAAPYLVNELGIDIKQARTALSTWMKLDLSRSARERAVEVLASLPKGESK